ncbi:hypothetical protein EDD15DRAFT_2366502 [Pisolithus albus]|nr:hypothetical protein EDD15DRAFT_2366502 [Pisolithus albus]
MGSGDGSTGRRIVVTVSKVFCVASDIDGRDLRSPEERDGGQLKTRSQVSTINGMLWELVEQVQRKKEWSYQGYLDRHTRREDRRHDREPTANRCRHSPRGGPYSKGTRTSRSERHHEKSEATDVPCEASKATDVPPEQEAATDLTPGQTETAKALPYPSDHSSQIIDCFVPDDEFFTDMLSNQPIAGPSGTTHDELLFNDIMEVAGADESMEPGNSAGDAESVVTARVKKGTSNHGGGMYRLTLMDVTRTSMIPGGCIFSFM